MKLFTKEDFRQVQVWMHRNARPLELALWHQQFESAGSEAVLDILSYYQNTDGGFGHGLEPDLWNPESSPYVTLWASNILHRLRLPKNHSVFQAILTYLEKTPHQDADGWFFSIPSSANYPHAPWWVLEPHSNKIESIGLTAELVGFILSHAEQGSRLFEFALQIATNLFAALAAGDTTGGEMRLMGYKVLIENLSQTGLHSRFDLESAKSIIGGLIHQSIEPDPAKWGGYVVRPSRYFTSPESLGSQENLEVINLELDYIIETRPQGAVWPITWSWFDNTAKYPKEFAISENWWKASIAISTLGYLKSFGRFRPEEC